MLRAHQKSCETFVRSHQNQLDDLHNKFSNNPYYHKESYRSEIAKQGNEKLEIEQKLIFIQEASGYKIEEAKNPSSGLEFILKVELKSEGNDCTAIYRIKEVPLSVSGNTEQTYRFMFDSFVPDEKMDPELAERAKDILGKVYHGGEREMTMDKMKKHIAEVKIWFDKK